MLRYLYVSTLVKPNVNILLAPQAATSPALPLHEYLNLPHAEIPWLIDGLVPVSGIVNLFGPPKVRKSFLALDMARHISGPPEIFTKWLGFDILQHGPVLYVQLDTPRNLWIDRFHTLTANGVDFAASDFYCADIGQTPYPYNAQSQAAYHWLREEVNRIQPVLVVIDTIREAHPGDENDSGHMQSVIASLVLASRPAALVLISHSRKLQYTESGPAEESLMDSNRGSGYVSGRVDTVIQLRGKEGDPQGKLIYQGRAIAHGTLAIEVQDSQLWGLPSVTAETLAARAILAEPFATQNARARALCERLHLNPAQHQGRLAKMLGRMLPA